MPQLALHDVVWASEQLHADLWDTGSTSNRSGCEFFSQERLAAASGGVSFETARSAAPTTG